MPEQTIEELKRELSNEKKKVSVLEQKLATYENDPSKSGYFAVKRIVNLQISYRQGLISKIKSGESQVKMALMYGLRICGNRYQT